MPLPPGYTLDITPQLPQGYSLDAPQQAAPMPQGPGTGSNFVDTFLDRVGSQSPLNPKNWGSMVSGAFESPFSDNKMALAQKVASSGSILPAITGRDQNTPASFAGDMAGNAVNGLLMGAATAGIGKGVGGLLGNGLPAIDPELERAIEKIPIAGKTATGVYGIARYLVNPKEEARIAIQKGAPAPAPGSRLLPVEPGAPPAKVYPAPPVKFKRPVKAPLAAPQEAQLIPQGLLAPPQTASAGLLAPEGSIAVPPVAGTQGMSPRYQQIGGDFAQNIAAAAAEKDRTFAKHLSSKGITPEQFSQYAPDQIESLRKEVNATYGKKYKASSRGADSFKNDVLGMMKTGLL